MKKHLTQTNNEKIVLDEIKKSLEDYKAKYFRALADYQNLQKRTEEQISGIRKYAEEKILLDLLNIFDTFEEISRHIKDTGFDLALKQFEVFLKSHNVAKIDVLNKTFDPIYMDCTEVIEGPENQVISELSSGYLYKDKILRIAKVKVGKKQIKL